MLGNVQQKPLASYRKLYTPIGNLKSVRFHAYPMPCHRRGGIERKQAEAGDLTLRIYAPSQSASD